MTREFGCEDGRREVRDAAHHDQSVPETKRRTGFRVALPRVVLHLDHTVVWGFSAYHDLPQTRERQNRDRQAQLSP